MGKESTISIMTNPSGRFGNNNPLNNTLPDQKICCCACRSRFCKPIKNRMKNFGAISLNKYQTGGVYHSGKTYYTSLTDICVSLALVVILVVFTVMQIHTIGNKVDAQEI